MYSTNNSNSEQNYVYCRNGCGARITFSDNPISKNGRKIPLQENGRPHSCPKSHFNTRRQEESTNGFVKKIDNTERHATLDSQGRHSDQSPKQEQHSDKITLEQQQYVDTIGPAIAEILSLLQEIYQHTILEATKKDG